MEEASKQRKARLEAFRKRKAEAISNTDEESESNENRFYSSPSVLPPLINGRTLRFRNYTPLNEDIRANSVVKIAKPEDIGDDTVEKTAEQIIKKIEVEEETTKEDVDLFNLAPKNPNWDLRRDVENRLKRLERRTQASIAQLIRMRLQGESGSSTDLADAVRATEKGAESENESD
ncbi:7926_t:CDS:2 [Paraglomus occultum]|uniref:7926_t:CDS:1 n=1 Tax=Paraglomus occultum TaxID=144539 RepID=A0A9N9F1F7_9GLOM|nr:7926_t:CDS:2 [Paraglomus occultum]